MKEEIEKIKERMREVCMSIHAPLPYFPRCSLAGLRQQEIVFKQ